MTRSAALRAACVSAERDDVLVSVRLSDGDWPLEVWVKSERAAGFDRLFTVRARKTTLAGCRVVSLPHLSADDVVAFDFERSWANR